MTATLLRPVLVLLVAAFAVFTMMSYDFVSAKDTSATAVASTDSMQGTILVVYGTVTNETRVLVNPSVLTIGERQFLVGKVSGKVEDIVKDNVFSGSTAYVALDSIVIMQEIDSRRE